MCPLQATYDIATSKIKYTEGFMVIPYNGEIITKPEEFWSDDNKLLVTPINYILCANFSAQTCLLFLLQSFWNYLANNIAKTTFMGSFEFKSYIIYSIFSMALFPLLQWLFRYDTLYTEVVPQLAYGIILFIIGLLGVRSHWRFTKLLRITRSVNSSQLCIVLKLEYFKEMNRYLTWGLFIGSTAMIILCADAFTPQKYLNSHKFTMDLLICHLNFTIWIVFVTLILIFYPSSNTLNDTLTMAKGIASTLTVQSKGNLLGPPNRRWSKYNPNNEDSSWSSQGSSRHDRTSLYLEVHDDSSARNNQNKSSRPTSVTFDIPPLPTSVAFDPNAPPSVYKKSSVSRDSRTSSPFYFTSNTLLPSPTYPPSTSSNTQQSSTNLPSSSVTPEHTINSNNINNNRRSLNFSKPLPAESLKYPSSPLTKINRNSLSSLTSTENQIPTGNGSTSHNDSQDISPLISSQLTRKDSSNDSLNSDEIDDDFEFISRKNARMSIISNNEKPIIKVTTSTASFKLSTNLTDNDESDTDDNKVTKFGKSIIINEFDDNKDNNNSQKLSRIPSSPTLSKYSPDSSNNIMNKVTPRTSSLNNKLINGPRRVKAYNNLKTDVVEMVNLNSPTSSNSSTDSPLITSPISPNSINSTSPTSSSISPISPVNDDSKLPIIPISNFTSPLITTK
ncbi:2470_t:CDS:2, partial [Dentiscutata heterogama]